MQDKGWFAMGGFETTERSRVLDLLGFDGQLVLPLRRHVRLRPLYPPDVPTSSRLYAGAAAQNRRCTRSAPDDPRLLPVAFVPLDDPDARDRRASHEALEAGAPR